MVLFGLGILLVSVSVIVYRYQSARLSPWTGKQDSVKSGAGSPTLELEDDDEEPRERPGVPTFTLDEGESEKDAAPGDSPKDSQATDLTSDAKSKPPSTSPPPKPQPQNPTMPPPLRPNPTSTAKRRPETNTTMPPPPPPPPTTRGAPSSTLRVPPPSTASTLRAPPPPSSRSLAPPTATTTTTTPSSSLLSTSTLNPSTRPSKKVLLDPGHSPLDWAHLTANPPTPTYLRGADVPPQLIRVPPSALRWHNGRRGRDAWGVWQGKVYNLSPYMKFHPGGVAELMKGAGRVEDGERLFKEVHPWVSWENMLGECLVGVLVSENEVGRNELEEMD